MRTNFLRSVAPLALGLVLFAGPARAQTAYEVTPQAGPWLICVTSYSGPLSKELTEGLIQEIRTKHNLPAYSYCRSAEERRKEQERIDHYKQQQLEWLKQSGLPQDTKIRAPKTYRIEDQYAVLVGGYKDDDAAAKALQQIRKLPAPSEKFMHQTMQAPVGADGHVAAGTEKVSGINPFKSAFPVHNPSIAADKHGKDDKPDPHLKEYNAGEPYSLLKNSKPWTLAIKSYQGAASVKQDYAVQPMVYKPLSGANAGRLLNASGNEAHALADVLRKIPERGPKGEPSIDYALREAYVLHTEYTSVVTIGGFDGPDDPKLLQMQKFIMSRLSNPQSVLSQFQYQSRLQFFAQPMPMAVPRP